MFGRRKIAMLVAEFVGTGILTLVYLSVQRSTIGVPYFVALAAGLAVAMAIIVIGENSGAHLNPAITLALWTARKTGTLASAMYIVAQLLGAWGAYGLYRYFVNSSLQTIGGHYTGRVLVAEAIGAFVLGLGWAAVAYKRLTAGAQASVIGVSYALGIIVAASAGIGLINPAVALGARAWTIWGSMGWGTYVLGPVLGTIIAVNLYGLLFAPADALSGTTAAKAESGSAATKTASRKPVARRKSTTRRK